MVATVGEGSEDEDRFVLAVVRGDMEVNETKLANEVKAKALRPAREEEIRTTGVVPGYGSPLGVEGALVVVDEAIPNSPNLIAGANEEGFHLVNVNYGRDFKAYIVADIASAQAGSACPVCGSPMRAERGVEIGNIFKLGTRYSESLGAGFLDRDGKQKPVIMGSYGIGVGRLLACVAEEHHDQDGLIWPISVAPYQVHLVSVETLEDLATQLYEQLGAEGIEVLYDDRQESLGTKFKDADLIGMPIRLTLTPRSMENGGVELKLRRDDERSTVSPEEVVTMIRQRVAELESEVYEGSWQLLSRLE
jgi:prolyl-tRNA synthetase